MPRTLARLLLATNRRVLGLNARNLGFVHGLNARKHFPLADDKALTKKVLESARVPVPETLAVLRTLVEVSHARPQLERMGEFVIKPARGRQGGGIVVISGHEGDSFIRASGAGIAWEDLRRAMGDILFGVHSKGHSDKVIVERRIRSHAGLGVLAEFGLPDIRVIMLHATPVMAMMRVPTRASGGRANLHQGALGIAVGIKDGMATRCLLRGDPVWTHPDNAAPTTGFAIPHWDGVLDVARRAARSLPLHYLGIDIVLDADRGPVVMEVNARPGLEIQNVNGKGMRRRLERIAALSVAGEKALA